MTTTPVSGTVLPRIKLAAQSVFGVLLLLSSAFLVLCYVTFNFFGALNNPLYSWLRDTAAVAQFLYFPAFLGALLSVEGDRNSLSHRLTGIFVVVQIAGGLLLFWFGHGGLSPFGWALTFGPNLRSPLGDVVTYAEALACLVPVFWISAIQIAGSIKAYSKSLPQTARLSSFAGAGLVTALLYAGSARLRLATAGQPISLGAVGFSLAAHIGICICGFLALQWLRLLALRFRNGRLLEFAARHLGIALLVYVLSRKIVMALLGFNNSLADWYTASFSITIVLFAAGITLRRLRTRADAAPRQEAKPAVFDVWPWIRRASALIALLFIFDILVIRFVGLDWEHVLSSLLAVLFWLAFLAILKVPARQNYSLRFLISLSAILVFAGTGLTVAGAKMSETLDVYANYDPSFFAIQQTFKPVVRDDEYAGWYQFLKDHANIRGTVEAPVVPLAKDFKPLQGPKPDIFIFVMDGLRRDYLSVYNPAVTFTPATESFARESTVFENAVSSYAGTTLADAAIFSGFQQVSKLFPEPLSRLKNLQKMTDADGYQTYLSYSPVLAQLSGFQQTFALSDSLPNNRKQEFGAITSELEHRLLNREDHGRPAFVFSQTMNVHILELAWGGTHMDIRHYPGFNDRYATAMAQLDFEFGEFIAFLKKQGLYDNSIIIFTADHGESLGEAGRESHVSNLTPEVIRIPLIIHIPERLKSKLVCNPERVVRLRDITPTIYYLVGHPLNAQQRLIGQPLFTRTWEEQNMKPPDHYFLMSSYMPVFGILSQDQKQLFYVDATLQRSYYYDLATDPQALHNKVTVPIRQKYEPLIRKDLERIDRFYSLDENRLEH